MFHEFRIAVERHPKGARRGSAQETKAPVFTSEKQTMAQQKTMLHMLGERYGLKVRQIRLVKREVPRG